jgi:hypothetical protein
VVTGRHAGQNTGRPDYAYTGRHEATPAPQCSALMLVDQNREGGGGMLVCNRPAHGHDWHHDEADGIWWTLEGDRMPLVAPVEPAGAVA